MVEPTPTSPSSRSLSCHRLFYLYLDKYLVCYLLIFLLCLVHCSNRTHLADWFGVNIRLSSDTPVLWYFRKTEHLLRQHMFFVRNVLNGGYPDTNFCPKQLFIFYYSSFEPPGLKSAPLPLSDPFTPDFPTSTTSAPTFHLPSSSFTSLFRFFSPSLLPFSSTSHSHPLPALFPVYNFK